MMPGQIVDAHSGIALYCWHPYHYMFAVCTQRVKLQHLCLSSKNSFTIITYPFFCFTYDTLNFYEKGKHLSLNRKTFKKCLIQCLVSFSRCYTCFHCFLECSKWYQCDPSASLSSQCLFCHLLLLLWSRWCLARLRELPYWPTDWPHNCCPKPWLWN